MRRPRSNLVKQILRFIDGSGLKGGREDRLLRMVALEKLPLFFRCLARADDHQRLDHIVAVPALEHCQILQSD